MSEIDHEHGVEECNNCQSHFQRPRARPAVGWIGADRVLLDDETIYGLRRWVVARRGEPPEVADLLEIVEGMTQADVYAWCIEKDDGYWYLWMVWKEPKV